MPFTPAHAAAAWPLWRIARRRLDLAALAIGALAPDFEYYVRLFPRRTISHQWRGIVLLDLPAALLVWWLLVHVLRRRLLELTPRRWANLAADLDRAPRPGWPDWLVLVLSCVIGSASHLLWDSFTHKNGWAVGRWAALGETVTLGGSRALPVYKVLQYGSGICGLTVLALLVIRWARRVPQSGAFCVLPARERLGAALLVLASCLGLALFAARGAEQPYDQVTLGVLGAVAGALAGFCIWALARGWIESRRATKSHAAREP